MFTKTSIVAVRLLTLLAGRADAAPASLRQVAQWLGESPSYLAKVAGQLVKARILRAHRGVSGGVTLAQTPSQITLRQIIEACQGRILGDFCDNADRLSTTCAFHQASAELHQATVAVLSKWTLSDLARRPGPARGRTAAHPCWMQGAARPHGAASQAEHK